MKLSRKKITKLLKGNHQTRKRHNRKKKPSKKRQRSFRKKRPVNLRRKSIRRRRNSRGGAKLQLDHSKWQKGRIVGRDQEARKVAIIERYNRALAEYTQVVDAAYAKYNKQKQDNPTWDNSGHLDTRLKRAQQNFLGAIKEDEESKLKSSWFDVSKEKHKDVIKRLDDIAHAEKRFIGYKDPQRPKPEGSAGNAARRLLRFLIAVDNAIDGNVSAPIKEAWNKQSHIRTAGYVGSE